MFRLDRTDPAWVEANRLRQAERPERQGSTYFWLQTCGTLSKNVILRFQWNPLYRKTPGEKKTHSRLKLRQRSFKLRCNQLQRLSFHIKLLVSTANQRSVFSFEGKQQRLDSGEGDRFLTWWLGVRCQSTDWTKTYQRERWSPVGFRLLLVSTLWAVQTNSQCLAASCNLWSGGQKKGQEEKKNLGSLKKKERGREHN